MKFSKSDRFGLFALVLVIVGLQFIIVKDDIWVIDSSVEVDEKLEKYIAQIELVNSFKKPKYFKFNPNKLDVKYWKYFGLSDNQIYLLDSFRVKSKFVDKNQVQEVLKISKKLFVELTPYIYFSKKYKSTSKKVDEKNNYSEFDPNSYSVSDWENIGFSKKQAMSIVSYKDKIGGFKSKKDFKKLFVVSDKKYLEIEKYLKIRKIITEDSDNNYNKIVVGKIDINKATLMQFKSVSGIGDKYAKLLLDRRIKLGGICKMYQLKELNFINDEIYVDLIKTFKVNDEFVPVQININTVKFDVLKSHPYISWKLAKSIVDFRDNFRKYKSVDEIINLEFISVYNFDKIKVYLTAE
ncbi:MAG: helix-hairpin-helix domain-containing protein [Ichthyobacteriaceae bacterium]|nr:helix-hairpin-helix domain-containing protein [Ichthyobacteriaceae bacterium]